MGEWKEYKIGEVCSNITDGSHFSPAESVLGTKIIATVRDMNFNSFNYENCKRISDEDFNNLVKNGCKADLEDVLLSKDGTIGQVILFKDNVDLVLLSSIAILKVNHNIISPLFFAYLLKSPRLQNDISENFKTGSALPRITLKDLKQIKVVIPGPLEQQLIASILSSLDDKIDLLHRQNKTLEQLAETLFRQWFVEEADEGWETVKLIKLGDIICGKTPSKKVREYFNGEIPFIKIPDMHGKTFVFEAEDSLTELGMNSQLNKTIPPRSICVSCIATVGLVVMNAITSQTNQQINSIVPYKEHFRFFIYLKMLSIKDDLLAMASGGTATDNLNTGNFSNIDIQIPEEKLIIDFHKIIGPMFNKIFQNEIQIRTLTQLRDILLSKLMSGEIRLNCDLCD